MSVSSIDTWLLAATLNLAFGVTAWRAGLVSRSGLIGGVIVGTVILAMGGWGAYLALCAFFALGTAATRLGYRRKAEAGLAQEDQGRRGSRHALANCGTGLVLSILLPFVDGWWAGAGLVAAFATASSDTLGSEVGQLLGRRAYLPTNFRRVAVGTEGAVSVEGTVAGVLGSIVLAAIGWVSGLYPPVGMAFVVIAAFVGTTVESLVGATLGRASRIGNEAMNFLNTLVGAAVAAAAAILWG